MTTQIQKDFVTAEARRQVLYYRGCARDLEQRGGSEEEKKDNVARAGLCRDLAQAWIDVFRELGIELEPANHANDANAVPVGHG